MSNINATAKTPLQTITQSTPARFVKDNAGLSAAATVATGIIAKNAADHSQIAATAIKKGAIPLVGAGVTLLGASMIHDAFAREQSTDSNEALALKVTKTAAGGVLVLAGSETVARSTFGASPLSVLGSAISHPVGQGLLMAAPGLGAAAWGAQDMQKNGLTLANTVAVGVGSSWAAIQVPLATMELAGVSSKATDIAFKGAAVVGGASLGLGAATLGKEAYENMQAGNWGKAALYGGGAAAAGVASAHVLGNATGISALSNLAGKALKNPLLAGSIAVVGLTGVAYAAYASQDKATEQETSKAPAK